MANMTFDTLALTALGGFAVLALMTIGITVWFIRQASKKPGEK